MQKQRKTVKQEEEMIVEPQNKVKDLSSSSKAIDNILSHILKLLYRCLNLHQMEDANCIMIVST